MSNEYKKSYMDEVREQYGPDLDEIYASKDFRTLREHLFLCYGDDVEEFKTWFDTNWMSEDMLKNLRRALFTLDEYSYEHENDQITYTSNELSAIVGYYANNIGYDWRNLDTRFMKFIKALNIPKDKETLFRITKNFDSTFLKDQEVLSKIAEYVKTKENPEEFDEYMENKRREALLYKQNQVQRIVDYIYKHYTFNDTFEHNLFEVELLNILIRLNYDADRILSNIPDSDLVKKDFDALHGKSNIPITIELYKEYMKGDTTLSKYDNNLGSYELHNIGIVPIPFTKEEFLNGIHNGLEEQQETLNSGLKKM